MLTPTWVLVLCTAGVDVGWQPVDSGGLEYVIQLDADALDILASGREFISEVPSQLGAVSRCRLKVGVGPVPRKLPAAAIASAPSKSPGDVKQVEHREAAQAANDVPPVAGPRALASLSPEPGRLPDTAAEPLPAEAPETPKQSWVTLILALVMLFASVAANAFLAWLVVSQRSRYRALTARIRSTLHATPGEAKR